MGFTPMASQIFKNVTRFDANKSTKGASKLRRDLINAEIANLRELLPLPPSTRQRLSQLQLMALVCVYVRKANYFQQALKCHEGIHQIPTPNIGFSKALNGFLMMMTQNGKLLYISDNAAEYLGHSMEDLLIHGDSVYDIIDKHDHQTIQCELGRPVNVQSNNRLANEESRLFLCRMNVSRNARRQMRFGDQKIVLVQGRFLSFLAPCSRNDPVFLATCTPIAMPESGECVMQGATNVFTSIHSMDMRFIHIDSIGEFYLEYPRADLIGVSWYKLLHWECTKEAQTKHRIITQSEQDRSCILLVQLQKRCGDWLWVHSVLQVKETSECGQQPVIMCTNQVLSEAEAAVMRTNGWLYHYYSLHNKLHYGLAYDIGRLLYQGGEQSHQGQGPEYMAEAGGSMAEGVMGMHSGSHVDSTQHHIPSQPSLAGGSSGPGDYHQHYHHCMTEAEPVDYSYTKRKSKDMQSLQLDVSVAETPVEGGGALLIISHYRQKPRMLLKVDRSDSLDQWNLSPPWSDSLQKVPDLCTQELSPYFSSTPPTPTSSMAAFSPDWASVPPADKHLDYQSDGRMYATLQQASPKCNSSPTQSGSKSPGGGEPS